MKIPGAHLDFGVLTSGTFRYTPELAGGQKASTLPIQMEVQIISQYKVIIFSSNTSQRGLIVWLD
jgi:hypothetical protein